MHALEKGYNAQPSCDRTQSTNDVFVKCRLLISSDAFIFFTPFSLGACNYVILSIAGLEFHLPFRLTSACPSRP